MESPPLWSIVRTLWADIDVLLSCGHLYCRVLSSRPSYANNNLAFAVAAWLLLPLGSWVLVLGSDLILLSVCCHLPSQNPLKFHPKSRPRASRRLSGAAMGASRRLPGASWKQRSSWERKSDLQEVSFGALWGSTWLQVGFRNRFTIDEKSMLKSIKKLMHLGIDFCLDLSGFWEGKWR